MSDCVMTIFSFRMKLLGKYSGFITYGFKE